MAWTHVNLPVPYLRGLRVCKSSGMEKNKRIADLFYFLIFRIILPYTPSGNAISFPFSSKFIPIFQYRGWEVWYWYTSHKFTEEHVNLFAMYYIHVNQIHIVKRLEEKQCNLWVHIIIFISTCTTWYICVEISAFQGREKS